MNLKSILNFERKINLDCPLSAKEFEKAFRKKYVDNKKAEFKGEIGRTNFKMWLNRSWWRVTDFSELNGEIKMNNKKISLSGKIELSDTLSTMILISVIVLPVIFIYQLFSSGFDLEILGTAVLLVAGFTVIINIQLYREKQNFIDEFNTLFRENLKANKKRNG